MRVLSKAAPKMVGLMSFQSNPADASVSRSSLIRSVNCGMTMPSSANSPPLTYGKASSSGSSYGSRRS